MKEEDDYQDKLRVQLKLKDDIEIGKTLISQLYFHIIWSAYYGAYKITLSDL